jgi:succinate-semialdehyde dehydrogenase/glutarate-semialdehyde dehydrogenase
MLDKYVSTKLFINGSWVDSINNETIDIHNPANEEYIGTVAHARKEDLNLALDSAQKGFLIWKDFSAYERSKIMRKAANILKERTKYISKLMTIESGKPVLDAEVEMSMCIDQVEWFAEEGKRAYGRIIPSRSKSINQYVFKEPVGVVAAFTPWNWPVQQTVRKIAPALAAGCSIIIKGPEETPASTAELIKAFDDAGIPKGTISLVFGIPSEISEYLIPHPIVKKITFTGSTKVGKQLTSLAGSYMKKVTMELGGHSPAIICEDANIETAVKVLTGTKFRNAGQICISPSRFIVQKNIYEKFVNLFVENVKKIKVGNGLEDDVQMGPLIHERRLLTIESIVQDAVKKGAKIITGGKRKGNKGYFFEPTILTNVSKDSTLMNEEPFGPLAPISSFDHIDEAIEESNRLEYGLAAYVYTNNLKLAQELGRKIESGQISINHHGLGMVENPFGGVKGSGIGSEMGAEGIEPYLNVKFISQVGL